MRKTINLDADLLLACQQITGLSKTTDLVREGLKVLLQRESAKRLALLGGTEPQLKAPTRRRPTVK